MYHWLSREIQSNPSSCAVPLAVAFEPMTSVEPWPRESKGALLGHFAMSSNNAPMNRPTPRKRPAGRLADGTAVGGDLVDQHGRCEDSAQERERGKGKYLVTPPNKRARLPGRKAPETVSTDTVKTNFGYLKGARDSLRTDMMRIKMLNARILKAEEDIASQWEAEEEAMLRLKETRQTLANAREAHRAAQMLYSDCATNYGNAVANLHRLKAGLKKASKCLDSSLAHKEQVEDDLLEVLERYKFQHEALEAK